MKKNSLCSSCLIFISALILFQGLSAWKAIGTTIPNDGNSIHLLKSLELKNNVARNKLDITEQSRFLRRALVKMQIISKDNNQRNILGEVGGISKSHTSIVLGTKEEGEPGTSNSSEGQKTSSKVANGAASPIQQSSLETETEPDKTDASASESGASESLAQSASSEESSQNHSSSSTTDDGSPNSATASNPSSSSLSSSSSRDFSGSSDSAQTKYTPVTTARSSVSGVFVGGAVVVILFALVGAATSNHVLEKRKKKRVRKILTFLLRSSICFAPLPYL